MKLKSAITSILTCITLLAPAAILQAQNSSYIFFAAPPVSESYYAEKWEELIRYYEHFISVAHANDYPIIIADSATYTRLKARIPARHLVQGNVRDIWIRDFGPVVTAKGVFKASYRPNYLPANDARYIEDGFNSWFRNANIPYQTLNLKLDGGNFCYNGSDKAVITRRALSDNAGTSEQQLRDLFRTQLGIQSVAILPEEAGDTTGHADGMVTWLAPNRIGVNDYPDAGFKRQVHAVLRGAFPGVEIVNIPWNPTDRYWKSFADSTGVYVNAMTTPNAIYVPTYNLPSDNAAVQVIRANADRPVIAVRVSQEIAIMGGAARCLCWQVSGAPARGYQPPGGNGGGPQNPPPAAGFQWNAALHRGYYEGDVYDSRDEIVGWADLQFRNDRSYTGKISINGGYRATLRGKVSTTGSASQTVRLSRRGNASFSFQMIDDAVEDLTLIEGQLKSGKLTFRLDLEQE